MLQMLCTVQLRSRTPGGRTRGGNSVSRRAAYFMFFYTSPMIAFSRSVVSVPSCHQSITLFEGIHHRWPEQNPRSISVDRCVTSPLTWSPVLVGVRTGSSNSASSSSCSGHRPAIHQMSRFFRLLICLQLSNSLDAWLKPQFCRSRLASQACEIFTPPGDCCARCAPRSASFGFEPF